MELMLLAVMLNLVAFTSYLHPEGLHGHAITLLLVVVALAQLAVGMSLVAMLMRHTPAPLAQAAQGAASEAAAAEPVTPAPAAERDPLDVERYDDLKW
ncbi:NADH:ubiquinone oxidoreductase subunit K [compost metagenome]